MADGKTEHPSRWLDGILAPPTHKWCIIARDLFYLNNIWMIMGKTAMLNQFGNDPKEFRHRWWNANQKDESAIQLANRLKDQRLKYIEGCKASLDVMEAFTMDHYYKLINEHVACWVRDKKPTNAPGQLDWLMSSWQTEHSVSQHSTKSEEAELTSSVPSTLRFKPISTPNLTGDSAPEKVRREKGPSNPRNQITRKYLRKKQSTSSQIMLSMD